MTIDAFDFGDWDVESLRLSIFHSGEYQDSYSPGLWESVTGQQADSIDSRPKDRMTRVLGSVEGDSLTLVRQDGRIDWTLQPVVGPTPQPSNEIVVAKIGSVGRMLPIFRKALDYSLESITSVNRIAFAPTFIREVGDVNAGFEQLSKYLPHLNLPAAQGGDFIFQINRRRRSEVIHHAYINRLAKWSLELVGGVSVRMGSTGRPDLVNTPPKQVRRLSLDVNTTPETSTMGRKRVPGLFEELVALAREITLEGDKP